MLIKTPKRAPLGKKIVAGVIVFETVIFGLSFFVYNRLEHSRDFRYKVRNSFPWALEKYYQFDEFTRKEKAQNRLLDNQIWATKD